MKDVVALLGWILIVFFGMVILFLNRGIGLSEIPWDIGFGFGLINAITLWIALTPRSRLS